MTDAEEIWKEHNAQMKRIAGIYCPLIEAIEKTYADKITAVKNSWMARDIIEKKVNELNTLRIMDDLIGYYFHQWKCDNVAQLEKTNMLLKQLAKE